MDPIPYPGCYQCPRCRGRDVYDSEKTIGAFAITYDVKGPVNPTFVNTDKIPVKRCRNCNEVAEYLEHPQFKKEMQELKLKKVKKVLTVIAGIVIIVFSITFINKVRSDLKISSQKSTFEMEVKKWREAASQCGIQDREITDLPNGDSTSGHVPKIDLGLFIEPATTINEFWNDARGKSVDCFSKIVMGLEVSKYLTYNSSEISSLSDFASLRLYDETFIDGLNKGLLGKATNYQGFLSFNKKHSGHNDDYLFLHLEWRLEEIR